MKRMVMTAIAVVLAAQAPAALAQGRGGDDRAERSEGRAEGRGRPEGGGVRAQREVSETGGRRDGGEPPRAREAPQAPQAPEAAQPRFRGDGGQGRGDGRRWDGGGDRPRGDGQRGEGRRGDGPRWQGRPGGDGLVDGRRGDGGDWRRGDQDHRVEGRRDDGWRDRDRRGDGRRDHDRWNGDRRDGDSRWSGGRDWDRHDDRRDYRRWERGRYPSVYFSSYRYRHAWRPPSGFYVRSWSYGEFYPRSWFGPSYWILDPWQYDLPLPPPGFDWVRSGPDALLIDQYTGRIVQVVRNIFWY